MYVFQSRTLFFLLKTCLGFNVRACAVHNAERACVEDSVTDVTVEVVEIRLTVLVPVLYH